jgi:hypothetical protein
VRGKAVVAPVRLRHRQRDPVYRLEVQRLRKRSHHRAAQPESAFGLIDIAGVGVTNVLSYQIARAVAAGEAQARAGL